MFPIVSQVLLQYRRLVKSVGAVIPCLGLKPEREGPGLHQVQICTTSGALSCINYTENSYNVTYNMINMVILNSFSTPYFPLLYDWISGRTCIAT